MDKTTRAYRFLTGDDTSAFCQKVTDALAEGWELYGHPTYAHDATAGVMRCGQAVIRDIAVGDDPATGQGRVSG
ncbi:MAG: DUF1737 domain-containing protein [Pseudomonadota bacterium]